SIAEKKCEPKDCNCRNRELCTAPEAGCAMGQRRKRKDSTLALIIRLHDEHDVLQRHDDDQGPENERDDTENGRRAWGMPAGSKRGFTHRIKRARADVAIHDAQCSKSEARIALETRSSTWVSLFERYRVRGTR